MQVVHLNVRSLTNNFHLFHDYFCDFRFDVLALTETWLNCNIPVCAILLNHVVRQDRRSGRSGGIYFYVSNKLKFKTIFLDLCYELCLLLEQLF